MADTKHEVKVDIIANSKKFRDELKASAEAVKGFEKHGKKLSKDGVQGNRQFTRATKEIRKLQRQQGSDALKAEKAILAQIDKKTKATAKARRAGKLDSQQRKQAVKELHELGKAHSRIHEERKKLMGLTRRERFNQRAGGALWKAGKAAAAFGALAIGGRVRSAMSLGEQVYSTEAGMANAGVSQRQLRRAYKRGERLGYGPGESAKQALSLARGTGMDRRELGQAVTTAQQMARVGNIDASQAVDFMGLQARGGVTGKQGKKELEKIFSDSVASGLKKARFGEFLKSVSGIAQRVQAYAAGDVNQGAISGILNILGKSRASGLQGSRGAQVAMTLDKSVRSAGQIQGNAEAWKAFMLRSVGHGRPGGGGTSYFDSIRQLQGGIFDEDTGAKTLLGMFDQMASEAGGAGSQEQLMALSGGTGLTIDQVKAIQDSIDAMRAEGKTNQEIQDELKNTTKEMKPLQDQANEVIKGPLLEAAKHSAKEQSKLLKNSDAIKDDIHALQEFASDFFKTTWPAFSEMLKLGVEFLKENLPLIKSYMKSIADGFKALLGMIQKLPLFSETEKQKQDKRLDTTGSKTSSIIKDYQEGKLTKEEADKKLFAVIKEAQKERKEAEKRDSLFGLGLLPSGLEKKSPEYFKAQNIINDASKARDELDSMTVNKSGEVAKDSQQEQAKKDQQESRRVSKAASDSARASSRRPAPTEVVVKNPEELADANAKKAAEGGIPMPNPGESGGQTMMDGDQGTL